MAVRETRQKKCSANSPDIDINIEGVDHCMAIVNRNVHRTCGSSCG